MNTRAGRVGARPGAPEALRPRARPVEGVGCLRPRAPRTPAHRRQLCPRPLCPRWRTSPRPRGRPSSELPAASGHYPPLGPVPAASRQEPGRTAGGEGSVVRGHGPQPRRGSSGVTHSSGHRPLVPEDQGPQSTDPGGSREGPSMGCAHPHGTRGKGSGGCGDGGLGPPERARELGALHCSRASDRRWTRRSTDSRP